jgi:hypothetical protein
MKKYNKYPTMIKKIVFAGCSITAGTELWEEKFVPEYSDMTVYQAGKANRSASQEEITKYNKQGSYPLLTGELLDIEIENIAQRGISNKEIAMRAILRFPENHYDNTIAVIQVTTHNRLLLNYADNLVNSAVIQPNWPTHFLNRAQNNIVQEFFLEFFNESLTMVEDYMSVLYAVRLLRSKNVPCYLLRISPTKLNQPLAEPHLKGQDASLVVNEKDPILLDDMQTALLNEFNNFNLSNESLEEITNADYLPQWHFSQIGHNLIANHLAEKIKCLHS